MKPYLTVLLIFSYCLILFYGCDNSKQDSETISKEIIQKATYIKTGSGLTPVNKSIPDNWNEHTVENVKIGLPATWNKQTMRDEYGEPMTLFYEGNDINNPSFGIMANLLNDYDRGLDYFKSQLNHELMHINGQTLNVLVSGDEISVLMPRIGNSNRGLVLDFMALSGGDVNSLKEILHTTTKQDYQAPDGPLKINQIAKTLDFHVPKGGIPNLEFNANDPCQNVKDDDDANKGTPWDNSYKVKADPEDEAFVIPPSKGLRDLEDLSVINYNAAVSVAFEGMKLLYGPMKESEYNKFENLWNPLFDYPTQEIIDYLNVMNPLISYFLGTRDAYMQLVSDFELLMLDASLAVEFDNREAWEQIMGEAQMYANTIKDYNKILESLSREINALGNPPNPNEQKCKDNENYRRFFSRQPDLNGTWQSTRTGNKIWIRNVDVKHEKYQGDINKGAVAYYIDHIPNQNIKEVDVSEAEANRLTQQGAHVSKQTVFESGQGYKLKRYINEKPNIGRIGLIGDNLYVPNFSNGAAYMYKPISKKRFVKFEMIDGNKIEVTNIYEAGAFKPRLDFETYEKIGDYPDDYLITYGSRWKGKWKDVEKEFKNSFFYGTIDGVEGKYKRMLDNKNIDVLIQEYEAKRRGHRVAKIEEKQPKEIQKRETIIQVDQEKTAFHQEMVNIIEHALKRDIEDRNRLRSELRSAESESEVEDIRRRIKDYDLRIIHQQTSLQQEKDLIASHQTGKIVRNRTAFDEYAKQKFINDIKENSARVAQAQKIANGIERQIDLLPKDMRSEMREKAYRILDGKVAEGDVETARKLANSLNNQITGMAEYDLGRAQEAEIDAQQNEFYAQMTIMAAGVGTVGLGSQALTSTFGAHSAASIYGAKVLGGVYGGTTGYLAGGPQQGVTNAISGLSPYGNVAVMFVDGYQNPALQDAEMSTRIFEGAKAAGTAFLMGKAYEFGARKLTNGARMAFGKDSRLFKPVIPNAQRTNTAVRNVRRGVDDLRTMGKRADAKSIIKTYESLDDQLTQLKANPTANASKIASLEKELDQLTASMNASYDAKWVLKYEKASKNAAKIFDNRLQTNYTKMIPEMKKKLAAKGYIVDEIDFKQFRNHNSAGTASMDLDLGAVSAKTGIEPKTFRKQDGTLVSVEEFMNDAQAAMDSEWYEMFGISTKTSEMNLVTSAHKEAFASAKMLDKNLDFSELTVDELKSVGKVLKVKTDGIDKNVMLTSTQKTQAKAREASKEVGNFINRKLKQDLGKVGIGTPEYEQLQADITYWEDMEGYLKKFGTTDLDPIEMTRLNRDMMRKTGGNGISDVINDVITYF